MKIKWPFKHMDRFKETFDQTRATQYPNYIYKKGKKIYIEIIFW